MRWGQYIRNVQDEAAGLSLVAAGWSRYHGRSLTTDGAVIRLTRVRFHIHIGGVQWSAHGTLS